jgi:UTP--glucose-1-phosphate uridylyltransferase
MLPIVDKPVVQYVVEELVRAGIARVLFVTGRRKRAIEDHFDADPELDASPLIDPRTGLQLFYTRQAHPAGLGDAVRYGEAFADGNPVVVALGDAIIATPPSAAPGVVPRLIEVYERSGASATVAVGVVPDEEVSRYGIAISSGDDGCGEAFDVEAVLEKPGPATVASRTAIMGRYVLGPAVFTALRETQADESGEVQLTAALRRVLEDGGRVVAVPLGEGERRHDIGSLESYCTAFVEHALLDPRVGPELRARVAALLDGE